MSNKTRNYGLHLTIDGYGAAREKLDDVTLLYETLHELPGKIGMHNIGFPHIAQFKQEDIRGITGIQMIVESHISIHTYSNKAFLSMDLYSCKSFDYKKVIRLIKKIYKIKKMEINVIDRGKEFPVNNLY